MLNEVDDNDQFASRQSRGRDSGKALNQAPRRGEVQSLGPQRMGSLCSPREMKRRLDQIKGIVFPSDCSNGKFPGIQNRSRRPNRKRLPPLEGLDFDDRSQRINTFYQAPIGEENFQIKHIVLPSRPVQEPEIKQEVKVEEVFRPPTSDKRAKPVNVRFERKVLYNHERTQLKLSISSKQATQAWSNLTEAMTQARTTIADWTQAQERFHEVVLTKYHNDVYNSPKQQSYKRSFTFASNTLARARPSRGNTFDLGPFPRNRKLTLKRQNSSPTKIGQGNRKRDKALMKPQPVPVKPEVGVPRIESSNAWVERQEARNLLPQTHKNPSPMKQIKLEHKENSSPSKAKKMERRKESRKSMTQICSPEKKQLQVFGADLTIFQQNQS